MHKVFRIFTQAIICCGTLFAGAVSLHAQSLTLTDQSNIDESSSRTWPAGPYSRVVTNYGILQTVVPLFDLKGRGGTSLSFSIYNRTMQTYNQPGSNATTTNALIAGAAGLGWEPSVLNTANSNANKITQWNAGNRVSTWSFLLQNGVTPINITREPGTRADATETTNSTGFATSIQVINQYDKSAFYYAQPAINAGPGVSLSTYLISNTTDKHGNVTTYAYTYGLAGTLYLPVKVTDASGRYYQINYTNDPLNPQISSVVLNAGGTTRTWTFNYDTSTFAGIGPALSSISFPPPITGAVSPSIGFTYNANSNVATISDLNGNRWSYGYGPIYPIGGTSSEQGVVSVADPVHPSNPITLNYTMQFLSSAESTLTCAITDQLGRVWQHIYYAAAGTTSTQYLPFPIQQEVDPQVTWNNDFKTYSESYLWNTADCTLQSFTDRDAGIWSFTYDTINHGDMLTKKDPMGGLTSYSYDGNDKLLSSTDEVGNQVTHTYDPNTFDLTKTVVDPAGAAITTNYAYTPQGELASSHTGTDTPTTYSNFDAYGNAQTITPPSGNSTTFTFDALNNKLTETDPAPGGTTQYAYDQWNRLTRTTNPDSTTRSVNYDSNSNPLVSTDENDHTTTTAYDGLNRPIRIDRQVDTSPTDDIVVTEGYDSDGNLTSVTNGSSFITTHVYDERHDPVEVIYPDSTTRQFDYDGNGNVSWRRDGLGRFTTFAYDADNRLQHTYFQGSLEQTNTWRADGIRTGLTDSTGTTTWVVNGAKQITQLSEPFSGAILNYTYDASGRKKALNFGPQTWTYSYDSALRPYKIQQTVGDSTAVSLSYWPNSSLETRMMGPSGALTTTYSYDSRGRTTQILHALSGAAQQTTGYGYDSVGNVLSYSDAIASGTTFSTGYGYDYANRLLSESRTGGTPGQDFTNSYVYDKDGNRTSTTRNGVASAYTIGLNDQFLSGDGCGASNYDGDGNPGLLTTCTKSYSFAYDFKDQPSSLTINPTAGAATSIAYVVDGDSHRVGKSVAGQTTKYIYDGDTVVAEIDPLGNITYELPDIGYVTSGVQNYYQENGLGSTLSVRSNAGALQSQSEYDAYGIYYQLVAGPQSDFRFAGGHNYVTDSETGLLELGHRYYIPILGRFLNQDPIGYNPTGSTKTYGEYQHASGLIGSQQTSDTQDPYAQNDGLNLYLYCKDNPIVSVDPLGTAPQWVTNTANGVVTAWAGLGKWVAGGVVVFGVTKMVMSLGGDLYCQHIDSNCLNTMSSKIVAYNNRTESPYPNVILPDIYADRITDSDPNDDETMVETESRLYSYAQGNALDSTARAGVDTFKDLYQHASGGSSN